MATDTTTDEALDASANDENAAHDPDVIEWLEAQPTREEWPQARLYDTVRLAIERAGYTFPPIRVASGWTGSGHEGCTLGVCYSKAGSKAGYYELFVSPTVDDAVAVVAIMLHEAAHAIDECKSDHGETYGTIAERMGLTKAGPDGTGEWPRQAYPSDDMLESLRADAMAWDAYPHAALNPPPPPSGQGGGGSGDPGDGKDDGKADPKQGTRLLKAQCSACGYTVRVTMKWASRGLPLCPVCVPVDTDMGRMTLAETKRPEDV